ncbi:MAG: EpsG family protein [Acutalibacteraceae bacterium]
MGLYIVIMASILLCGIPVTDTLSVRKNELVKRTYTIVFLTILWILLAFRGATIGSDTDTYIGIFEDATRWAGNHPYGVDYISDLFHNTTRYETGYIVYNRLLAGIFDDVQWLFIITATFCMFVCYKLVINHSHNVALSLFLFVSLRLYYFTMSGMRQCIAIFICILAYDYVRKRKLVRFLLLVLLAMQFHTSAVIFVVVYPLSFVSFNLKTSFLISSCGVVAFFAFDKILVNVLNVLPDYYEHYTSTERFEENKLGNILVAAIQISFLLISVFSRYGKQRKHYSDRLFIKEYDDESMMKFMVLISILLSIISLKATTLDRLFYYFWIFAIIYIPNVIEDMYSRNDKVFMKIAVAIATMAYNVTILYLRPEWSSVTPYMFFWQ